MLNQRLHSFVGGDKGDWSVVAMTTVVGEPLAPVARVAMVAGEGDHSPPAGGWVLRGVTSNERYAAHREAMQMKSSQAPLGRPEATHGALIPIRKSAAWWALSQDERRELFEETSRHISIGLRYLPAIARRLHHCRDLATAEPFDFITLFDYSPDNAAAFDDLVADLRATAEWAYVDREVDLRLARAPS